MTVLPLIIGSGCRIVLYLLHPQIPKDLTQPNLLVGAQSIGGQGGDIDPLLAILATFYDAQLPPIFKARLAKDGIGRNASAISSALSGRSKTLEYGATFIEKIRQ